jgi:hypothetical protein
MAVSKDELVKKFLEKEPDNFPEGAAVLKECHKCYGTGLDPTTAGRSCAVCMGVGSKTVRKRTRKPVIKKKCRLCLGTGKWYIPETRDYNASIEKCTRCDGSGFEDVGPRWNELPCQYSGKESKEFWRQVHLIGDVKLRMHMYGRGCRLQEDEVNLLSDLYAVLKKEKAIREKGSTDAKQKKN